MHALELAKTLWNFICTDASAVAEADEEQLWGIADETNWFVLQSRQPSTEPSRGVGEIADDAKEEPSDVFHDRRMAIFSSGIKVMSRRA